MDVEKFKDADFEPYLERAEASGTRFTTMAELGDTSREQHDAIGRLAVRLDIDRLVVVGPEAGAIHAGAVLEGSWGEESVHVPDVDAAVELLGEQLAPGDVVLVKASRSARLDRVVDALLAGPVATPAPGGGRA